MVVATETVIFPNTPPDPDTIAKTVSDVCGLSVIVAERHDEVGPYRIWAELAFECDRDETVVIYCFRRDAISDFGRGWPPPFGSTRASCPISNISQDSQGLTLTYHKGIDLTLLMVTLLATERLGGIPDAPLDDELRTMYGGPISIDELQQRLRKGRRRQRYEWLIWLMMLPFAVVVGCVSIVFELVVLLPWRIWKTRNLWSKN